MQFGKLGKIERDPRKRNRPRKDFSHNYPLEEVYFGNSPNPLLAKRGSLGRATKPEARRASPELRMPLPLEPSSGAYLSNFKDDSAETFLALNPNLKHFCRFRRPARSTPGFNLMIKGRKSLNLATRNENFPRIQTIRFDIQPQSVSKRPLRRTDSKGGLPSSVSEERMASPVAPPKSLKRGKTEHPWVSGHLSNLFAFLVSLFTYERRLPEFSSLSPPEREILISVVRTKNYLCKEPFIRALRGFQAAAPDLWLSFKKQRRKEEHLKYGFKMIFKQMQSHYLRDLRPAPGSAPTGDRKLLFYLHHFGRVSFGREPEELFGELRSGKLGRTRAWKKLTKFVLPEMGVSADFCGVKTINREFIKNVSQLRPFALEFLNRTIDVQLFLGYCWTSDWEELFRGERVSARDLVGIDLLRSVGRVNQKEVKKLFSEWSNLIGRASSKRLRPRTSPAASHNFELIKNSIRRSNFKFPWTFVEVWEAAAETFLSFVEFVNFDHFPKSTKSRR